MTAATDTVGGGFDMSRVITRTFGVLGRNITTFGLLALVLVGLPGVLTRFGMSQLLAGGSGAGLGVMMLGGLVGMVTAYLLQAAVVHGTIADLNGRPASFSACLQTGARSALPLLGLALLFTFAVALGMMLLLVPGFMLMTAWIVAAPAVVVERIGVFESFGRSARLTKGHRWAVFGLLFVFMVVYYLLLGLVSGVGAVATSVQAAKTMSPVQMIVGPLLSAATVLIGAVGASSIYYELRSAKEGVGPDTLAAVFD